MLEIWLGHGSFCAMAERGLLAVLSSVYAYVAANYWVGGPLWPSVIAELEAYRGLMVFLEADWSREWSRLVCVTDASETGYGVSTMQWPVEEVAAAGRLEERSRFERRPLGRPLERSTCRHPWSGIEAIGHDVYTLRRLGVECKEIGFRRAGRHDDAGAGAHVAAQPLTVPPAAHPAFQGAVANEG